MENRANYALVGLFTLAVIAGAFAFVYWFKRSGEQGDRSRFRVVFTGSVSGLSKGSVVRFNGLRVGEVTDMRIAPDDPAKVWATIEVDRNAPVKKDTEARLETLGLTGVATVQLTGGKMGAEEVPVAGVPPLPTIAAERSDYQDLLETAQRLSKKIDTFLTRADSLLGKSEDSVVATVKNVQTFTDMLARNSDSVDTTIREVASITQKVSQAANRLDKVLASAENFLGDGQEGATNMMKEVAEAAKSIKVLAANLDKRTLEISAGINRFTGPGLREIEALAADSRKAVGDLSRAVRSLERNPQQLLFGGRSNIPEYRR